MATNSNLITAIQPVRPGDLITADFINSIISALFELEDRVSVLEAEGHMVVPEGGDQPVKPVVITAAVATSSAVSLAFEVYGSGLDPAGLKTFSLNNVPFDPQNLRGDDSKITFIADRNRFVGLINAAELSNFVMAPDAAPAPNTGIASAVSRMNIMSNISPVSTAYSSIRPSAFAGLGDRISEVAQPAVRNTVLTIEANSGSRASRVVQMITA